MYPNHIIGIIYARIELQFLDPYAKERPWLYIKRLANECTFIHLKFMISYFNLVTSLNDWYWS